VPTEQKHVYIVDDDESVCRSLKLLLSTFGFEVSTFLSAEEYFSKVPNSDPGCLVMDIHMPGLNGWEALKRSIALGVERPVIMISANKTSGNNERALNSGAVGYLLKPFTDQALVDLIQGALAKKTVPQVK
jgi:FixJ family two-component response regulator